jgi:hypothetical protein
MHFKFSNWIFGSVLCSLFQIHYWLYVFVFNKPFYIHWYPFKETLVPYRSGYSKKEYVFLPKVVCKEERFWASAFMAKYKFFGRGKFVVTDQRSVDCCHLCNVDFWDATLPDWCFDKVIIYPEPYFSTINQVYHKGSLIRSETLVFSWKDLNRDIVLTVTIVILVCMNLHALYFHGLKGRDQSSVIFRAPMSKTRVFSPAQHIESTCCIQF